MKFLYYVTVLIFMSGCVTYTKLPDFNTAQCPKQEIPTCPKTQTINQPKVEYLDGNCKNIQELDRVPSDITIVIKGKKLNKELSSANSVEFLKKYIKTREDIQKCIKQQ